MKVITGQRALRLFLIAAVVSAAAGCQSPYLPLASMAASSYTVTFDDRDATVKVNPRTKTVTSPATTVDELPAAPSKTGYNFAGWFTAADGGGAEFTKTSSASENITVYAKWSAHPVYVVTFDSQGATTAASPSSKSVTLPATTVAELPAAPVKTGWLFGGWWTAPNGGGTQFKADTAVAASLTVYARWDAYSYTVTFDDQGADAKVSPAYKTVASPATTVGTLPADPGRTGKFFAGWWTAKNGQGSKFTAGTVVASDLTVYAYWSAAPVWKVTFDPKGGSAVAQQSVIDSMLAEKPVDPTRSGYDFYRWCKDSSCTLPWTFTSDAVAADLTLYAAWTLKSYSISYTLNGGTNAAGNPAAYTIETPTITLAAPARLGYTFAGWFADAAFTTPLTAIGIGSTGDKTAYAKWTYKPGITATPSVNNAETTITFSGTCTFAKGTPITAGITQTFSSYSWFLDDTSLGLNTQSISIDTTSFAAKTYRLTLVVSDAAGNVYSGTCLVTVSN